MTDDIVYINAHQEDPGTSQNMQQTWHQPLLAQIFDVFVQAGIKQNKAYYQYQNTMHILSHIFGYGTGDTGG